MDGITTFIQSLGNAISDTEGKRLESEIPIPNIGGKDLSNMERILREMFTESTGMHICDSGGSNGRSWQQNRINPPWDKEPIRLEGWKPDDWYIVRETYHFMNDHLDVPDCNDSVNIAWREFYDIANERNDGWYGEMTTFTDDYLPEMGYDVTDQIDINTYNEESSLSQVLQYRQFTVDDKIYLLVQLHQGADVRGGYTEPYLFVSVDSEWPLSFDNDFQIHCTKCEYQVYTDDGYHWYMDVNPYPNEKRITEGKIEQKDFTYNENTESLECPFCKSTDVNIW